MLAFGVVKLILGKRQVAKYAKLAEAQKAHLESVRDSRQIISLKGEEIPFGVRALEFGIEVEGIVISPPATPNSNRSQQTLVGSENGSAKVRGQPPQMAQRQSGRPLMMYQPSPYIALPAPSYHGISGMPSSSTSAVSIPNRSTDDMREMRLYSDPMLQMVAWGSRPESPASRLPASAVTARLEGLSPSQNGHHRARGLAANSPSYPSSWTESRTPTPPDGHRNSDLPSANETAARDSLRSDSSGESDEPHLRPHLMTAYSTPNIPSAPISTDYIPETARGDLSLLHNHRLSHAAEVGQLLPRNSRTSKFLAEGTHFHSSTSSISHSSTQRSPARSPTNSFIAPSAASDGVCALEVALPPTMPVAVALVHPVLRGRYPVQTRPSPGERPHLSEDLSLQAEQLQQRIGNTIQSAPAASAAPDVPESTKEGPNKLPKKRGSGSTRSSMDVDLEAQK